MTESAHRCCAEMSLTSVGDCGSVTGFDLTLQRCKSCGAYVMDFFWGTSSTSNPLPAHVKRHLETVRDGVAAALATLGMNDVTESERRHGPRDSGGSASP